MKRNLGAKEVEQYVSLIAETRGLKVEQLADYKKMMLDFVSRDPSQFDVNAWASKQLYIALGMFLQTAAMLGVDACPMEGINAAKYDEILGLSASGYGTVVVATAGYRSSQDPLAGMKKVRFQPAQVIERR
jgi:nitroreductase